MQLLCTSDNIAFIQSLRIALDGEDIETFCSDPMLNPVGLLGPIAGSGGRIFVLHEEDWDRAVEIYREFSNEKPRTHPVAETSTASSSASTKWIVIAAIVAMTVAVGVLLGT